MSKKRAIQMANERLIADLNRARKLVAGVLAPPTPGGWISQSKDHDERGAKNA